MRNENENFVALSKGMAGTFLFPIQAVSFLSSHALLPDKKISKIQQDETEHFASLLPVCLKQLLQRLSV